MATAISNEGIVRQNGFSKKENQIREPETKSALVPTTTVPDFTVSSRPLASARRTLTT